MNSNWPTKKLGEIREKVKSGKAPVGTVPYIEIGNVDVDSKKIVFTDKGAVKGSVFCPENSILISRVRPTRGAVVLIDRKHIVSSAFTIIKPLKGINPKLIFYFLAWNKKFFEYLRNLQKGTSYPSVRESDILDFKISFPEDFTEQKKIVYVLDSIQEAVRVQDEIIEKTKELKKSLMRKLFTEGTKREKLKKTEIGKIPKSWKLWEVNNVKASTKNSLVAGPFGSNIGKRFFVEDGVPVIRGNNLTQGEKYFIDDDFVFITEEKSLELRSCEAVSDDIIFTAAGTLGQVGIIPQNNRFNRYIISNKQIRLRLDTSKILPLFAFFWFASDFIKALIHTQKSGTSIPVINLGIIKNLPIPHPPLLEEQKKIVKIFQTVDQKIEIEQKKRGLYEELFKTMLNKLMNGEIEVDKINFS